LNLLHKTGLRQRVYGPELMLRLCRSAAAARCPLSLWQCARGNRGPHGESPQAVLRAAIAGPRPRPSAPCRPKKRTKPFAASTRAAPRSSSGLGYPKQDFFAHRHRGRIHAVQVCVGRPLTSMRAPSGWPAVDAATRPRMGLPPMPGTAPPVVPIPGYQYRLSAKADRGPDPPQTEAMRGKIEQPCASK